MDIASELHPIEQISCFCQNFHLDQVSLAIQNAVELCVIDTLACAYGAMQYEEIPDILAQLNRWYGYNKKKSSYGKAQLWFNGRKVSLPFAVYCNAMLTHALELDDVHRKSKSHVGAVVIPVAFSMAEALQKDSTALKEAIICGYEVMSRVGMAMDVSSNRMRGWHTTSIIGPFGAAAVAGKLLGFEQKQYVSAFGLAGTQASGLWAFLKDGATCKKMHVAHAAWAGIMACILTKGGMIGPKYILDAEDGGLYSAVSDYHDISLLVDGLGQYYAIEDIDRKLYPCCRSTHPIIDSAIELRKTIDFVEDIESIEVLTYEVGVIQCGMAEYPATPTQAKFSSRYVLACALLFGCVDEKCFSPSAINNPKLRDLFKKVVIKADEKYTKQYPEQWGCKTTVTLQDRRSLVCEIEAMKGSPKNPLSKKDVEKKFWSLVEPILGKEGARNLFKNTYEVLEKGYVT